MKLTIILSVVAHFTVKAIHRFSQYLLMGFTLIFLDAIKIGEVVKWICSSPSGET